MIASSCPPTASLDPIRRFVPGFQQPGGDAWSVLSWWGGSYSPVGPWISGSESELKSSLYRGGKTAWTPMGYICRKERSFSTCWEQRLRNFPLGGNWREKAGERIRHPHLVWLTWKVPHCRRWLLFETLEGTHLCQDAFPVIFLQHLLERHFKVVLQISHLTSLLQPRAICKTQREVGRGLTPFGRAEL